MYWKWILIFGVIERLKYWFFFLNVLDFFILSFEFGDNGYMIFYKLVWRICGINKIFCCFNSGSYGCRLDSYVMMFGNWCCVIMVGICI